MAWINDVYLRLDACVTTHASATPRRGSPPTAWASMRGGGCRACETAAMTHGGMGRAKAFHVERYMRETGGARIGPVGRGLVS